MSVYMCVCLSQIPFHYWVNILRTQVGYVITFPSFPFIPRLLNELGINIYYMLSFLATFKLLDHILMFICGDL